MARGLRRLYAWSAGQSAPKPNEVEESLADHEVVSAVVERFRSMIGLWDG
jgi:hypothetical protein